MILISRGHLPFLYNSNPLCSAVFRTEKSLLRWVNTTVWTGKWKKIHICRVEVMIKLAPRWRSPIENQYDRQVKWVLCKGVWKRRQAGLFPFPLEPVSGFIKRRNLRRGDHPMGRRASRRKSNDSREESWSGREARFLRASQSGCVARAAPAACSQETCNRIEREQEAARGAPRE